MLVLTLTDCPASLRGDLTKWLLEINTGVFVGQVSARVRENLWERVCGSVKSGRATMVYSAKNEQRLDFRVHNSIWEPIDYDGIKLMLRPSPSRIKKQASLRLGYSKASKFRAVKKMRGY
jgi:CRISPR-associated protein Cas2